jgi:hypothetical protein
MKLIGIDLVQQPLVYFFKGEAIKKLSHRLALFCSAVHAYEIAETLTFVENGIELSNYKN